MKLNFIFGLLFSVVALQMKGAGGTPEGLPPFVRFPGLEQEVYITRDTCKSVEGRFPGFSPFFVIYPDKPCDASEAAALTDELGIASYAHTYSGTVCVMNPLGKEYDAVKDLEAYKNFLNKMRVFTNLKIIGIGKGATFVNRTIAGHAGAVAGIVSLNGRPAKTAEGAAPVPAFIAGTHSRQVAAAYILQNQAEPVRKEDGLACYANRQEPLQQVVVSANKYISLKEAFAEAWKTLLCKNYRFNNYEHTWYTGAQFDQYGTYELEPYIMPEDWGITRRVMKKDLIGTGDFLWYEFHPEATLKAEKASVPLLLLLHGNNNDPRTQAETTAAAVKENTTAAEKETTAAEKAEGKKEADSKASENSSEKSDESKESTMTGTISDIKDFMFTVSADGKDYAFTFEADKKPEGLSEVKDGDKVTVTYTGTVNEVDAFDGTILSVTKAK